GEPSRTPARGAEPASEVFQIGEVQGTRVTPPAPTLARSALRGRWKGGKTPQRGRALGPAHAGEAGAALAWAPTLRAAAPYQADRRGNQRDGRMVLRAADLRAWSR